ncbi:PAS domain S-box protein [Actinoplanes sp. G11-F43]|uniref:PAS domain S-box protein n=1 Tax=Actinoplanes sp. G11-F43 TaxID=3424130 RepID=UPI003D349F62
MAVQDPARLAQVDATGLVDGAPSEALQRLTALASRLLNAPVSAVSLVEADRQYFAAGTGLAGELAATRQIPLSHSYCKHVVESGRTLSVDDARIDPVLGGNPSIEEYQAIAYLGVPLRSPDRSVLGTLCVVDHEPRIWSPADIELMEDLGLAAASEIAARMATRETEQVAARSQRFVDTTLDAFIAGDSRGVVTGWNQAAEQTFGWTAAEAIGRPVIELIIPERLRADTAGLENLTEAAMAGQRVEVELLHRDGRVFPAELALSVLVDPDGHAFHTFVRDISDRKRTQHLRDTEQAVAGILLQGGTAQEAARDVVTGLGGRLGWPYLEYWHRTPDQSCLERLAVYSTDPKIATLMEVTRAYAPGVGVPGTVWAAGASQWIADLPSSDLPRAAEAGEAGLHAVAAVPVRDGAEVVGVLMIADHRRRDVRDDELIASLESVSAYIGQAVQRRRAADLDRELAVARDSLARIVDNLTDFLWTVELLPDGQARTVHAQGNIQAVFGAGLETVTAEQDMTEHLARNIHDDDLDNYRRYVDQLRDEQPAEIECRMAGLDGVTRWIWTRGVPRRDGDRLFVDGLCSDVTERHHAKAVAEQQAELLRLAPIAVIVRDLDSRIIGWNTGAELTYGWPSTAVVGKSSDRLLDTRYPAGRAEVDAGLAGESRWEGELDQLRSDGTRLTVHSHQSVQYDDYGAPAAILEVNLDVTDRRKAESALADRERLLHAQFALSTVGQAMLHVDGTVIQANPALAGILGYATDELAGRTIDSLTHPDDRHLNWAAAAGLFVGDAGGDRHQRLIAADGRIVEAQIGVSLLRDHLDRPATIITAVTDISARVSAERDRDVANRALGERNAELQHTNTALAEADAMKRDLMSILSHEIRTPLTTISGYTESLLSGADELAPPQQRAVTAIARSVSRLDNLCQEVLKVCALPPGERAPQPDSP